MEKWMDLSDEYDMYIEELLWLQFKASEIFKNRLTKGETREDFFRDQLKNQFSHLKIWKGHLFDRDGAQSPQCDVIVCKQNSRERRYGSHDCVDINDCIAIVEIKSSGNSSEFADANQKAEKIKKMKNKTMPLVGIFCYTMGVNLKTVLRKFGHEYSIESEGYVQNKDLPCKYPSLDFVLSLHRYQDEEKNVFDEKFFIVKNAAENFYTLEQKSPVSKNFFRLLNREVL